MAKLSKAAQIVELQKELLRVESAHAEALAHVRVELGVERNARVAAQRGLVPYVRSLEAFDRWLKDDAALRERLRPVLAGLGLWEIKLGYDPDQDIDLTVAGAHRH